MALVMMVDWHVCVVASGYDADHDKEVVNWIGVGLSICVLTSGRTLHPRARNTSSEGRERATVGGCIDIRFRSVLFRIGAILTDSGPSCCAALCMYSENYHWQPPLACAATAKGEGSLNSKGVPSLTAGLFGQSTCRARARARVYIEATTPMLRVRA